MLVVYTPTCIQTKGGETVLTANLNKFSNFYLNLKFVLRNLFKIYKYLIANLLTNKLWVRSN